MAFHRGGYSALKCAHAARAHLGDSPEWAGEGAFTALCFLGSGSALPPSLFPIHGVVVANIFLTHCTRQYHLGGVLMAGALLLSACTTAPSRPASPEQAQAWQQHRQAVARYSDWALSARVTVSTEDDAWNGRLYWRQTADTYHIRFNAPTGQGAFQLDGDGEGVDMHLANGQILHDVDAETLLYRQLGWRLPLDSLRYWVTGLPVPDGEAELYFGVAGRLDGLLQSDWRVRYPAYRQADGAMLPRKVYLENYQLDVRLVIDRWELARHQGDDGVPAPVTGVGKAG